SAARGNQTFVGYLALCPLASRGWAGVCSPFRPRGDRPHERGIRPWPLPAIRPARLSTPPPFRHGLRKLDGGVNTARPEAYRMMIERGFWTSVQGVARHRPKRGHVHRPGVYVLDARR